MSRDKHAAERRRQRRHDFELGCEKFKEMAKGQQLLIAGRQCGKTNMIQEFLTSPEFIKSLPKEHK